MEGPALLASPQLAVRLGPSVCRWADALPVVVGLAAFGPQVAAVLREEIAEVRWPALILCVGVGVGVGCVWGGFLCGVGGLWAPAGAAVLREEVTQVSAPAWLNAGWGRGCWGNGLLHAALGPSVIICTASPPASICAVSFHCPPPFSPARPFCHRAIPSCQPPPTPCCYPLPTPCTPTHPPNTPPRRTIPFCQPLPTPCCCPSPRAPPPPPPPPRHSPAAAWSAAAAAAGGAGCLAAGAAAAAARKAQRSRRRGWRVVVRAAGGRRGGDSAQSGMLVLLRRCPWTR